MALNLKNKNINKTKRKNKQINKDTPNHFAFGLLRFLVSGKLGKKTTTTEVLNFSVIRSAVRRDKPKLRENGAIRFFALGKSSVVLFVY